MELAEFQHQWAEAQRLHPLPARQADFDLAPRVFQHCVEAEEAVTGATLWAFDEKALYVLRLRAAACLQIRHGLFVRGPGDFARPAGVRLPAVPRFPVDPPAWLEIPAARVDRIAEGRTVLRLAALQARPGWVGRVLEEDVDLRLDAGLARTLTRTLIGRGWMSRALASLDRAVS